VVTDTAVFQLLYNDNVQLIVQWRYRLQQRAVSVIPMQQHETATVVRMTASVHSALGPSALYLNIVKELLLLNHVFLLI